jgi:hypothetical protein
MSPKTEKTGLWLSLLARLSECPIFRKGIDDEAILGVVWIIPFD